MDGAPAPRESEVVAGAVVVEHAVCTDTGVALALGDACAGWVGPGGSRRLLSTLAGIWGAFGAFGFGGLRYRRVGLVGGHALGQALVAAGHVVLVVERVDLGLELGEISSQRLGVEVGEQGLVKPLVLALGGGVSGLAGDGLDAETARIVGEVGGPAAPLGVESDAVVGQEALGDPVSLDALLEYSQCGAGVLAACNVGGDLLAGVVIDELEDHRRPPARQRV